MTVECARRAYLLKRRVCIRDRDPLAVFWQAKQEEEPAMALPGSFPSREKLALAGYTTVQDIFGASSSELQQAGLSSREAEAALAALALL